MQKITISELSAGYQDNGEGGVRGYGGNLDIRPPYQREFVYRDKQRDSVIDTVMRGFPLNVMYWSDNEGGKYEVIDGQQRTISVCQYVAGDFSVNNRGFNNLQKDEKSRIMNYPLHIYLCKGTDSEKLEWFKTINIAGERLTDQELRNAVYHGSWVAAAKKWFSKINGPAYGIGSKYLTGSAIRQEYLETAIKWINNGAIEEYMSKHQHDEKAEDLWNYFKSVIEWTESLFPKYRREMKGIPWGELYNAHKDKTFNPQELEEQAAKLMQDEDVTNKKGIYFYVLGENEKHLNIRAFSEQQKREAFERQDGKCAKCGKPFALEEMEADHITPWSEGGKTVSENCQMLCIECNRRKGAS